MKKILFIAYYYPPIKSGGSQRPLNFIKYLEKDKYIITVLTSNYGLSVFKQDIIRIFDISFNKYRKGFRYFIWLFFRIISEFLNKVGITYSIYSWWRNNVIRKSDRIIDLVKPDLIIATYPPVETLEIGLFFSKKFNIPLISDFRDGLLFEPIEKKLILRSNIMRKFYINIEKKTVDNSFFIMTVSEPITEYFKDKYKIENVFTIYTGYDPDDYPDISNEGSIINNSFFNIVFTGRLNLSDSSNRTGSFFEAVSELIGQGKDLGNKIRIYLAGEFNKNELKLLNDLMGKQILVNCGYLNRKDAIVIQRQADLLLIITSISRSSIVTTKIFEYLKSAKPILALTYKTELEKIIKDTKTGWVVHPYDKESIKSILRKLIEDNGINKLFNPDLKKINSYSIKEQMKSLDSIINRILN